MYYAVNEILNNLWVLRTICIKCGKGYKHKSSLYKHTKWECGLEGQFKCKICQHVSKQKAHFVHHMYRYEHVCSGCGRRYKYFGNMNYHSKYCGKKSFHCQYCERQFTSKFAMQRHVSRCYKAMGKIDIKPPFIISTRYCKSAAEARRSMDARLRLIVDDNKFKCLSKNCNFFTNVREKLIGHLLEHND
nr:unnamed protein product [Callosobruchus analis]